MMGKEPYGGHVKSKSCLISIIMPVYNGEKYIRQALRSIKNQNYTGYELIVVDGGSTDDTLSIVSDFSDIIDCLISEKDHGMYDAINKGFSMSSGEILCWLNSDDLLFPNALKEVVELFSIFIDVNWVTGRKVIIDDDNKILKIGAFKGFNRAFIRKGLYRGNLFGFITQESTFWRRSLYERVGGIKSCYKYASDYDLWLSFSCLETLYSYNSLLGAFRLHEGQKSENIESYYKECDEIIKISNAPIKKIIGKMYYVYSMFSPKGKIVNKGNGLFERKCKWFVFE